MNELRRESETEVCGNCAIGLRFDIARTSASAPHEMQIFQSGSREISAFSFARRPPLEPPR